MENSLYSDIIGFTYDDDAKRTMTQMKVNYSDQATASMSDSGLYPMDNTLAGGYGDMDLNTAMMDFMSINDSRDAREQIDLPNYMKDVVSTVLTQQQDFPLELTDSLQTDLDLGAATLWADEDSLNLDTINPDDLFTSSAEEPFQPQNLYEPVAYQPLELAASPQPQTTRESGGKRKIKTRSKTRHAASEPQTPQYSVLEQPSLEELGVQSYSPLSDAGSSTDEGSRPRQRRPRVSYDTLTEEQKYQRIRELNNEASRLYRQRHRHSLSKLESEQRVQEERNRVLRAKMEGLEKLRDEVQTYVNNVFRQRFSN
ncbi:uncharacterized protein LOC122250110 [Penaeus japonicus]|uniref:uncharacterized protein LOC122250110 n=1 Tax=Penaeus japonicus TaxID=27405 RepID=UPI001C710F59|nr:uncharacterized protein LOC122250110 [Penaeus japonicus]